MYSSNSTSQLGVALPMGGGVQDNQHHDDSRGCDDDYDGSKAGLHDGDVEEDWIEQSSDSDSSDLFDLFDFCAGTLKGSLPLEPGHADRKPEQFIRDMLHIEPAEEIRIIDLILKKDFHVPLHCRLRSSRLDDTGQHETTSYAWGQPLPNDEHLSEHIVCEIGNRFVSVAITKNLKGALEHIRKRENESDPRRPLFSV